MVVFGFSLYVSVVEGIPGVFLFTFLIITNAIVVLEAGQSFPTHKHTGFNMGTILQGEFTVEDEMGNKLVKKAGETYIGAPNVWHTAKNESKEKTILEMVMTFFPFMR